MSTDSDMSSPESSPVKPALGFTLWAVFRRNPAEAVVSTDVTEFDAAVADIEAKGVTLRGIYDASSFKADADLMFWVHGQQPEVLQWALRRLRRTALIKPLLPTWNAMGVHRDAEFTADHRPSYMRGKEPEAWLTVYPFVRSYEWYLLPDEERKGMLGRHGRMGREFPQVLPNTVAAFALGDYEWILALEAPELVDLVDLMRHLRSADARLHVREEVPFYTGRRITSADLVEVLT